MSEAEDRLAAQALKAASVTNDGVSVVQRALSDEIKLADREAAKAATADMGATVRGMFSKIVAPGGH